MEEQQGKEQDPEGPYGHMLKSPDGYGLTVSRGNDTDGTTIVQLSVFSKCVGNPTDKPDTWGKFAGANGTTLRSSAFLSRPEVDCSD
ncbi:hypothetical protein ACX3O0_01555 [Homoserinimonas sp. A447]